MSIFGSSDVEYGSMEPVGEQIKQVHCDGCGQDFKIWTKTSWEIKV